MKNYTLAPKEPLVIYGGGKIGLEVSHKLINAGFHVSGILDNNPSGVSHSSVPVFSPDDGYRSLGKTAVWISLANGVQHMSVARKLSAIGYEKIIFLPLFLRSNAAKIMAKAWNMLLEGEFNASIPFYDELWVVSAEDFILDTDSQFVTAVIHKDHVYTINLEHNDNPFWVYTQFPNNKPQSILDLPIDDPTVYQYLISKLPFHDELNNMLESVMFSPNEFFITCAAPASLNKNGLRFNLFDGHHRCVFLVNKGFKGIPLKIIKSEWEFYFKESQAQNLMNYCKTLDSLPFEVKHPAFIHFPIQERKADCEFDRLYSELYFSQSFNNKGATIL